MQSPRALVRYFAATAVRAGHARSVRRWRRSGKKGHVAGRRTHRRIALVDLRSSDDPLALHALPRIFANVADANRNAAFTATAA
ncbi:hypothetical protein [Xanthomonas tesorieronis]|uniref:hypothetical protein n=1 Tax=Xanthomonas tesorieronis TaxID=3160839 RepID=UPI0035173670